MNNRRSILIATFIFLLSGIYSCHKSSTKPEFLPQISSAGSGLKIGSIKDSIINSSEPHYFNTYFDYIGNEINWIVFEFDDPNGNPNWLASYISKKETVDGYVFNVQFEGDISPDSAIYIYENSRLVRYNYYDLNTSLSFSPYYSYEFEYDSKGNLKYIITTSNNSSKKELVETDEKGNVIRIYRPDGLSDFIELKYDDHPNPLQGYIGLFAFRAIRNDRINNFMTIYDPLIHFFNKNNIVEMSIQSNNMPPPEKFEGFEISYYPNTYPKSIEQEAISAAEVSVRTFDYGIRIKIVIVGSHAVQYHLIS